MEGRIMSWWFKMPADAGRRPEILAVGWAGYQTWLALLGVDSQQDFGARIPRRFADPVYLASQAPPDGPAPELYALGLERCLEKGLAVWDAAELVLDAETYEDWRGAKSARQRKHEERQRDRASRGVTKRHEESRAVTSVTHVTPPDQTRPDQTRPESEPPAPAHACAPAHNGQASQPVAASISASVDQDTTAAKIAAPTPNGALPDIGAEAHRLAKLHDELGVAVAKAHGLSWRSAQTRGPSEWLPVLHSSTEDECRHVLAMLAAEADERARSGIRDPLKYLRTPTSQEVWSRVVRLPDEESAREFVRSRFAGQKPAPAPEPVRRARRLG
jgi:hypothetical protein